MSERMFARAHTLPHARIIFGEFEFRSLSNELSKHPSCFGFEHASGVAGVAGHRLVLSAISLVALLEIFGDRTGQRRDHVVHCCQLLLDGQIWAVRRERQ
jgi:hypothetical protein